MKILLAFDTSSIKEAARRQTQPNPENLENPENPAHENQKNLKYIAVCSKLNKTHLKNVSEKRG